MAKIQVLTDQVKSSIDPLIFGHFTEHAFKNIYDGMYEPGSPLSDEDGFRVDVLEALRKVKTPLLRYPGGNFVSNYHWEDGIGPKSERKRVFEYAWLTEESNQFGTVDFIKLCRKIGAEPLICVNMGTGTVEEAMHWVEYCNGTGDTYYANLRRSHGYEEPFGVKYWGLGNEMYGLWQMNHKEAEAYADYALEFAKALKWVDPSIKLIACGYEQTSDWGYTVMKKIGTLVDYVSAHHYAVGWGPFERDNYRNSLYIPEYMQKLTDLTMAAVYSGMNDTSDVKVAWDEWNLFGWLVDRVNEDSSYTLHNTIITALILNMFIRNSDKIGMANYSTFVNINGAVSTHENGIVKRAQYYAFELLANHTGSVAYPVYVDCEEFRIPVSESAKIGRPDPGIDLNNMNKAADTKLVDIPKIDCAASGDEDGRIYLSIVNKDPDEDIDVTIALSGLAGYKVVKSYIIYHECITAANTIEAPDTVVTQENEIPAVDQTGIQMKLKKHSVNLLVVERD